MVHGAVTMNFEMLPSIARIEKEDGSAVGVGFVIGNGILLTCAHVIEEALGLGNKIIDKPDREVKLKFPKVNSDKVFTATIKFWEREKDLSVLELTERPSIILQHIKLAGYIDSNCLWGHDFRAFGFPQNDNVGRWASGKVSGIVGNDWLQIEDVKGQGQRIKEGYSGSPVYDQNIGAIIGMVVALDTDDQKKIAFILPVKTISGLLENAENIIIHIDQKDVIENEINFLCSSNEYKQFEPLLNLVMWWPKRYDEDILAGILLLIKRLLNECTKPTKIKTTFEYISMGYIPPEWGVEKLIKEKNRELFIILVASLFDQVRGSLSSQLKLGIPVPVVLVIMNDKELKEITSRSIFENYPDEAKKNFDDFESHLLEIGLGGWQNNYPQLSRDWMPFRERSIEKLIINSINKINANQPLIPVFIDIHDLSKDGFRVTLKKLRERGCIVILDSISMHHPTIQRELRKSMLDAFPRTIVAEVLPAEDSKRFINQMILVLELYSESEFYKRLQLDDDKKCKLLCKELKLDSWLEDRARELVKSDMYSFFTLGGNS
jgi:hypothetical protein